MEDPFGAVVTFRYVYSSSAFEYVVGEPRSGDATLDDARAWASGGKPAPAQELADLNTVALIEKNVLGAMEESGLEGNLYVRFIYTDPTGWIEGADWVFMHDSEGKYCNFAGESLDTDGFRQSC